MLAVILLVLVVIAFTGGFWGYRYGPPYGYWGGGVGLVLLIVLILLLFRVV